ncbi:hypothetical protein OS493_023632 [Desmophyllum pertusum]|uniref:C3H1-type domain-containing protein n=1 Tax=Desmophyllum pertusum TaxID=174260 RepID=A0A9W9ZB18_9CNID|nr:hypothetical protein OS493_023632 [Desmophyllum pertusum]
MCPGWTKGTCKLNKSCTFAHGEKELTAWNEHLEKMENELKTKTEEEKKKEQTEDGALQVLLTRLTTFQQYMQLSRVDLVIPMSQRQPRSLQIKKAMEFVLGQRMFMVPSNSVNATFFDEDVQQVTSVVSHTARRREYHGKKTGIKVLLNQLPQKTRPRNKCKKEVEAPPFH